VIRALKLTDYPRWQQLWQAYLRFYREEVSDEVTAATFRRLRDQADGMIGFVATDEKDDLVGIAHLVFHPSTWSTSPYCYLEDLYVSPDARGTGTARDLIEAVFAEADRRGATRTYWETQQYNGRARSLYDQVAHATSFIIYER
jgi:GNAT superfamily N-acetyltransferase